MTLANILGGGAILLSVTGAFSQVAYATPSTTACTATNNPHGNTDPCNMNYAVLDFGNPYAGGLTIDFKTGLCDNSLNVGLAANPTTARADDFLLEASCTDTPNLITLCCIIEDDGAANPEVTGIGIRGLDTADIISLNVLSGAALGRDTDMHTDLQAYVYAEGGNDTIYGAQTPSTAVIPATFNAGDGNDAVYGFEASETIYAGTGADWVEAGDGADVIYGNDGGDKICGGFDGDTIHAGAGTDYVCGDDYTSCTGAGGGACNGDPAGWTMDCSAVTHITAHGNDTIWLEGSGSASSFAFGNGGADRIYAGTGNSVYADYVYGGEEDDELVGNGNDVLHGGDHADEICSNASNDSMYGDTGSDVLYASTGAATVAEGGPDPFDYCNPAGDPTCENPPTPSSCPFVP